MEKITKRVFYMEKQFVEVLAYDGTLVRIPSDKVEEFSKNQLYINSHLSKGKPLEEILTEIKKGSNK